MGAAEDAREGAADDYSGWIGRQTVQRDIVTERLVSEYRVTLAGTLGPGEVPAGYHWCVAPDLAPPGDLGRDGHPRPGLVLPRLPLPRRMWAGGEIAFARPFRIGDTVTRVSTVTDVTFKTGRSGRLGFVTVSHRYEVEGETCVTDRQDIVYREDPKPDEGRAAEPAEDWDSVASWHVCPDPTLLFRYSALTFNGHRIHYDHPYATGVEGYGGLVVHGPLQSVWMQNLAVRIFGALPATFGYRGLTPLIAGQPVTVEAREAGAGLELRVRRDGDGVVTMRATASR